MSMGFKVGDSVIIKNGRWKDAKGVVLELARDGRRIDYRVRLDRFPQETGLWIKAVALKRPTKAKAATHGHLSERVPEETLRALVLLQNKLGQSKKRVIAHA